MATIGLTAVPSEFGASETITRLVSAVKAAGMTVFARIDHGAGAGAVHMALGSNEVVIFGNARGGTPLMQANPQIGIDLPLKALVYQDAAGKVWVAYNDPNWLAERHGLDAGPRPTVAAMTAALKTIVAQATGSRGP
jgi:uncharacterized protein (DUF302 family)